MYPNHEYSKYIDQKFNYSNQVDPITYPSKVDVVDALFNMRFDGGIRVEPRLQEYLKKKKYYHDNNIKPCIKPEDEYLITSRDKKMIRALLQGNTDIYTNWEKYQEDSQKTKQYFPSKQFRDNDSRVQKIEKPNMKKPENWEMFVPGEEEAYYENKNFNQVDQILDSRDLRADSKNMVNYESTLLGGPSINNLGSFNPRTDAKINWGKETGLINKQDSQFRIDPKDNTRFEINADYFKDTRNKSVVLKKNNGHWDNYASFDANSVPDYSLGIKSTKQESRYGSKQEAKLSETSEIDTKHGVVMPNIASKNKRGQSTYNYQMANFEREEKEEADRNFETAMIRGMPSHTPRSYGYRQAEEHYFDYIDQDMFRDDSVEWWARGGESTRRNNKSQARQKYTREIY